MLEFVHLALVMGPPLVDGTRALEGVILLLDELWKVERRGDAPRDQVRLLPLDHREEQLEAVHFQLDHLGKLAVLVRPVHEAHGYVT